MFGFDIFPVAAASLDMTADFSLLFWGLCGLLVLSAVGIALSAGSDWLHGPQWNATISVPTTVADLAPQKHAKAA